MSLERSAQKEYFESEYKRYRKQAEAARQNGKASTAATYYEQCADALKELAELETTDTLAQERRNLASNLTKAAKKLSRDGSLRSADDETENPGMTDSQTGTHSGRSPDAGNEESETDADMYLEAPPEMGFGDVGGMTELKQTLRDQVIDPLERPELYEEYELGIVNGLLLHGPPGTGKTYVTEALAGELSYNYVNVQASEVTSSLVGEAAENMAELFRVARDNQPCLLFFDEIEAIASERSGGSQKTMSESQMITQFLTEMSEMKGEDVVIVGATNLPDDIDGAAWRRFDERIEVPPPDATARAAILRVHLRERPVLTDSIDWTEIKDQTEGYSASDLELIASKAARKALQQARDSDDIVPISQSHLETAIAETASSLDAWDDT
ncbi:26S protease regulatory subunit [Haloquadratum walsbyi]|uniref:ATPase of the AAA+ class n=1 Tax=Haloquadratum walsbyi J07HQW2 TaxID=1238425 RepID=U1PTU2_9EURY|nr:ATP-binding protein [Haloquadratum walsbyi]ERG97232.1 MAG: ATPase of the AAA+ class [Haloquadratum walsbyi J07HQW2]